MDAGGSKGSQEVTLHGPKSPEGRAYQRKEWEPGCAGSLID